MYHVERAVGGIGGGDGGGGGGGFVFLGAVGRRRFVDAGVPAGAGRVTYRIQAVRSTAAGPEALFEERFGTAAAAVTVGPRAAA